MKGWKQRFSTLPLKMHECSKPVAPDFTMIWECSECEKRYYWESAVPDEISNRAGWWMPYYPLPDELTPDHVTTDEGLAEIREMLG